MDADAHGRSGHWKGPTIMKRPLRRSGYSLVELVICTTAATVLMAGMASAVAISTKTLTIGDTGTGARSVSIEVQRDLLADLQHATGFTERTTTSVTMILPDQTGDGHPDKVRYAWSGVAGAPLTIQLNGGIVQSIASNIQQFQLSYATKTLNAPVVPDEAPAVVGRVLFVSGGTFTPPTFLQMLDGQSGTVTPTALENAKINLFTSWGYSVSLIASSQPASDFTTAFANNDVVFASSEPPVSSAQNSVCAATIGVVNENTDLVEPLGFCKGPGSTSGTSLIIDDVAHYITQSNSPLQQVTLFSNAQMMPSFSVSMSPDMSALGTNLIDYKVSCATIAAGKRSADLVAVPARRVQLPWTTASFDSSKLTASGLAIFQLALQWGSGLGGDGNPSILHVGLDKTNNSGYFYQMSKIWEATPVTLATNAELLELSAYVNGLSMPMRLGIYTDNAGKPGNLLTQTGPLTGGLGWLTGPVPTTKLTPGKYWLAISSSNDTQEFFYLTTPSYSTSEIWSQSFGTGFPATWGTPKVTWSQTQLLMYGAYIPTP